MESYYFLFDHLMLMNLDLKQTSIQWSIWSVWLSHMNVPLHSCDWVKKISIEINVATDEGNSRNETWHWTNNEIGVAVKS